MPGIQLITSAHLRWPSSWKFATILCCGIETVMIDENHNLGWFLNDRPLPVERACRQASEALLHTGSDSAVPDHEQAGEPCPVPCSCDRKICICCSSGP